MRYCCSLIILYVYSPFPGDIIAVKGNVDDNGFYCGSFKGETGLVPAGFVQEMDIEDCEQHKRLLNQTLSRPLLPSLATPHNSPLSSNQPSFFSPSGSLLTHTTGTMLIIMQHSVK